MARHSSGKRSALSRIIRGRPKPSLPHRPRKEFTGSFHAENRQAANRIKKSLEKGETKERGGKQGFPRPTRSIRKATVKHGLHGGYEVMYR